MLHCVERQRECADLTKRAQTHIDTVSNALCRGLPQYPNQALSHTGEKRLVVEVALAISCACFGEGENHVNVGGKVEFLPAELAHADNHHLLGFTAAAAWDAVWR